MTEFMGKIKIDIRAYHGDASSTPVVWSKQMMINGTQQRKSVRIMIDTFF